MEMNYIIVHLKIDLFCFITAIPMETKRGRGRGDEKEEEEGDEEEEQDEEEEGVN